MNRVRVDGRLVLVEDHVPVPARGGGSRVCTTDFTVKSISLIMDGWDH